MVKLNITDDQGVLLGQIDLSDDDLRHPESIGDRIVEQLPADLRPMDRWQSREAQGLPPFA